MRAAVAGMVPAERRGTAYGFFNAGYGFAWFAGSAALGALYDASLFGLLALAVTAQIAAAALFLTLRQSGGARANRR